jgi:hypothetical protein
MKSVLVIIVSFASILISCTQNSKSSRLTGTDEPAQTDSVDSTASQENRYCGHLIISDPDDEKEIAFVIMELNTPFEGKSTFSIGYSVSRETILTINKLVGLMLIKRGDKLEACLNGKLEIKPSRGGTAISISQFESLDFTLPVKIKK